MCTFIVCDTSHAISMKDNNLIPKSIHSDTNFKVAKKPLWTNGDLQSLPNLGRRATGVTLNLVAASAVDVTKRYLTSISYFSKLI
jgi:hypothetical protein